MTGPLGSARCRLAVGLGGVLLTLTACSGSGDGTGPPAGGAGAGAASAADRADGTASCTWSPEESGNPYLIDVEPPAAEVPADGTAGLRMATDAGDVPLTLDRAGAPCAVASLVHLAERGYFDDTPCHRQTDVPGLQVLQCGDPTGTGVGGPTYTFPTEVDGSESYPRGTVAMANSGQGLDGSQFFLVWGDSRLPPDYTVLGRVEESGLAVLDAIAANGNDGSNGSGDGAPTVPVNIRSMTVLS